MCSDRRPTDRTRGGLIDEQKRLYLIIGVLLVAVFGFGIHTYQQEQKPDGVELKLNENGVSLEAN
jgi:hypothetical protein